jgi:hypothetical protein
MPRSRKNEMAPTIPAEPQKDALGGLIEEQAADAEADGIAGKIDGVAGEKDKAERTTFHCAGDEVEALVRRVMQKHSDLNEGDLTFSALFAKAGKNSKGPKPAITEHGYPVLATIKKSNAKARLDGAHDFMIILDENAWEPMSRNQREALVDEQLRRLALKREGNTEEGEIQLDDAGRPKLQTIQFDVHFSGFKENLAQYGNDSPKKKEIAQCIDDWRQMELFSSNKAAVG